MTEEITTKTELMHQIKLEREALEAALKGLDESEMAAPAFDAGWSVKDTLAHISAWERLMVGWVETSRRGERPERPIIGDDWVDRLNARFYEEKRNAPLSEVLDEFQASGEAARRAVQALSEEELFDPEHFPWRDGSPLFTLVAANTLWHYQDHRQTIAGWREEGAAPDAPT